MPDLSGYPEYLQRILSTCKQADIETGEHLSKRWHGVQMRWPYTAYADDVRRVLLVFSRTAKQLRASKGGRARAAALSPERRREIAKLANAARREQQLLLAAFDSTDATRH